MFEHLFGYPISAFRNGQFVLLSRWPWWILAILILAVAAGLALLIRSRRARVAPGMKRWRLGVIWLLEASLAAVLLILLWKPALMVAELKPQQNIIAVVVDDSRSMAIEDNGSTREAEAVKDLENGTLAALQKRFQVRLYRMDAHLEHIAALNQLQPTAPATHINESLQQLADDTSDLPIGAVVLLSDGSDNSGGVSLATISALRSRRIPVHTVGFGTEQTPHDVEIDDASLAPRALADSRLVATVRFHQRGYGGQKAMLRVRDGNKILAAREVTLGPDGNIQTEQLMFNAGSAGPKALQFSIDALPGEQNRANNAVTRLINVESDKQRILYIEGEPRWEYKFIRRAEDDDGIVQLVSMLRTTENKIYRQGIDNPNELADGFPSRAEDLFAYQGLVIGSVQANYFTPAQQQLIREFVDRRGGGLLLLGGRFALADGGWGASSMADLLPVVLPNSTHTFHREPATVDLTPAGADSIICRLVEDPAQNVERWKKLPYLMNYQEAGKPKLGAAVLAEMNAGGRKMPLLVTENYGRGRTAVLATGGTWRWRMLLPVKDQAHEIFWRQLLRWLVTDTPGQVTASVPSQMLFDEGRVQISAKVRDKSYQPAPDANVEAHILGPGNISATLELRPDPQTPGTFRADWNAEQPGSYFAQVIAKREGKEIGHDALTFERMDGVAENFHTGQNRALLQKLARETGGAYWRPQDLGRLPSEITYSQAGITIRQAKDLWNMPALFLVLLVLCSLEWLLRRKWGVV